MEREQLATVDECAAFFVVTRKTLENWRRDGCPVQTVDGRPMFRLSDVARWDKERAVERAVARTAPDEAAERARKMSADADLKELELAERRGKLVDADAAIDAYREFTLGFSATVSGRLRPFERDIIRTKTPGDARRLTDRLHAALMQGAQDFSLELEQRAAELELEGAAVGSDA